MTYKDIDPKIAGIYIFKNNINGKCYVGQSVLIRKRIRSHFSNIKTKRYDSPLYRAIEKYGLHNFTINILEAFVPDPEMSNEQLIKKLDELEIKYIAEYEAYTKGYNCTVGGDYGTLGLKMTPDQRKKMSEIAKRKKAGNYKPVYLYNIKEKTTIYAISVTAATNIIKAHRCSIFRAAKGEYPSIRGHIVAFTLEELEHKKKELIQPDCKQAV